MVEDGAFISNILFILLLGVITSYEDARKNKISNKYVAMATVFAFLTNVLWSYLSPAPAETKMLYIQATLLNAFLAFAVGFLLWRCGIWRAGDGKLFFAYSFLLPISTYYYGFVMYFPSFTILLNTLVPTFLLLTLNVWVTTSNEEKFKILRGLMNPRNIVYAFLSLINIQWILSILFKLLSIKDTIAPTYLSILALLFITDRFQELIYKTSIPLFLLRLFFDYETLLSPTLIIQFTLMFAFFILLIPFITNLGSFRFNDRVKLTRLKPGMCCAERIVRKGRFYERSSTAKRGILKMNYESLTADDIERLKRLSKQGKVRFDELVIRHTIPFAPLLFLGVLLTILLKGDIITHLILLASSS